MKRIIDKETMIFLRDDTQWNDVLEIALEVEPPNDEGFIHPKWTGTEWVEGATEIPTPTPQEPTLEERVQALEQLSSPYCHKFSLSGYPVV